MKAVRSVTGQQIHYVEAQDTTDGVICAKRTLCGKRFDSTSQLLLGTDATCKMCIASNTPRVRATKRAIVEAILQSNNYADIGTIQQFISQKLNKEFTYAVIYGMLRTLGEQQFVTSSYGKHPKISNRDTRLYTTTSLAHILLDTSSEASL